jgi:hypothetical protein
MGASLTMIDRHYGHLARDGREHAIRLLDTYRTAETETLDVHAVDAGCSGAAGRVVWRCSSPIRADL